MISFNNPVYSKTSIFGLRKKSYEEIEEKVKQMVIPVTKAGFEIMEFGFRSSKQTPELYPTLKRNFILKFQKNNYIIDLSVVVPELVNDNYIVISGKRKIPIFQVIDIPVIRKGGSIRVNTNVLSLNVLKKKSSPFHVVNLLNKEIPLVLLFLAYFGIDKIKDVVDLNILNDSCDYGIFIKDLKEFYEGAVSFGSSRDDILRELGKHYSQYSPLSKGRNMIYGLDLALEVDVYSTPFFKTGNILLEILEEMKHTRDDQEVNYLNKRIRSFEYVIGSIIARNIFNFCMSCSTTAKPKFNINTRQILKDCNVSEIVQFDFAYNPIHELTNLSRFTLVGPGGFKKSNAPVNLRDINDTMFKRVCVVDTPDREGCGVSQNLLPDSPLDEKGKFSGESEQTISVPVSIVPFLEKDDQTRLQMASSQMRQAVMLENFDVPIIRSGCENLYTEHTSFIKVAKEDGEVLKIKSNFLIIVRYDNGEPDIFDIRPKLIYVDNFDFYITKVQEGQKFKKGDIIAESNFLKEGNICIGKNLLTGIMVYHGYNYEDAIVISQSVVRDRLLDSEHMQDLSFIVPKNSVLMPLPKYKRLESYQKEDSTGYRALPYPGELIPANSPYAIVKEIPDSDFKTIFKEERKYTFNREMFITDVKIFPNSWNESIPEYKEWIKQVMVTQINSEEKLRDAITEVFGKDNKEVIQKLGFNKFRNVSNFKMKEKFEGVYVEMRAVFAKQISLGDKLSNRHGNKGVISKIVPDEEMPRTKDGRKLDVIINPLGIISRMNIGQLFELHLSMSVNDLKNRAIEMLESGVDRNKIKKYLVNFIKIIDNTKDSWYLKQFKEKIKNIEINHSFLREFSIIEPPFESTSIEQLQEAMKYTNTEFTYKIFDPRLGGEIQRPIAVGYLYWMKMIHMASEKLSARGIGPYSRKTLQPSGGRSRAGGQKLGEMEVRAMIAMGGLENVMECLTTKSDSIQKKNQWLYNQVSDIPTNEPVPKTSEAINLLKSYLRVIGIEMEEDNE